MAGFEIVVRPVVFPDIRPRPAQSLPPPDDPDKGFALIHGNGGKSISLSNSYSGSTSSSAQNETQRRVDRVRVYQQNEDKTINKSNFVDMEVANKIWAKGPSPQTTSKPFDLAEADAPDLASVIPKSRGGSGELTTVSYQRVKNKKGVEVLERDIIQRAVDD